MIAAQRIALQLPPRRAASECAKMQPISRAEGGQLQAPVGWRPDRAFHLRSVSYPDTALVFYARQQLSSSLPDLYPLTDGCPELLRQFFGREIARDFGDLVEPKIPVILLVHVESIASGDDKKRIVWKITEIACGGPLAATPFILPVTPDWRQWRCLRGKPALSQNTGKRFLGSNRRAI